MTRESRFLNSVRRKKSLPRGVRALRTVSRARLRAFFSDVFRRRGLKELLWVFVIGALIFWRLGYASLWDPDEGFYAAASSEMRATHDWFAPIYNGAPFFDKPILFYALQITSFAVFGETEFAVRFVPAISALVLLAATWWLGASLFDRATGGLAAVMLALLPATFALSSYAILDMTFTALLVLGLVCLVLAALQRRSALQWPGYVLLALAVLTKGPLGLALPGLAFVLALIAVPDARKRLWNLHWEAGLALVGVITLPWFFYMWWRYGAPFVEGYLLRENLWLFSRSQFKAMNSRSFYLRVVALGLLPWTPLLIGRLVDIARGAMCHVEERLLWVWTIAVIGFFTVSTFRLDHYVYPAAPALCILAARAWVRMGHEPRALDRWTRVGALSIPMVVTTAGIVLAFLRARVPLDLPAVVAVVPVAFIAAGVATIAQLYRHRWRTCFPSGIAAALLVTYATLLLAVLPRLEEAKPIKALAQATGALATTPGAVAAYRLNRWNPSWRFYVRQNVTHLETIDDLTAFLRAPSERYCIMQRVDYDALVDNGLAVRIVTQRSGLLITSARMLRRDRNRAWGDFVVVTNTNRADVDQSSTTHLREASRWEPGG